MVKLLMVWPLPINSPLKALPRTPMGVHSIPAKSISASSVTCSPAYECPHITALANWFKSSAFVILCIFVNPVSGGAGSSGTGSRSKISGFISALSLSEISLSSAVFSELLLPPVSFGASEKLAAATDEGASAFFSLLAASEESCASFSIWEMTFSIWPSLNPKS